MIKAHHISDVFNKDKVIGHLLGVESSKDYKFEGQISFIFAFNKL